MKNLMIVLLFAVGLAASAQSTMTPQEFYQRCGAACDPQGPSTKAAHNRSADVLPRGSMSMDVTPTNLPSATTAVTPGDEVYGYLRSSVGEFARRGEEVKLYLDIVKDYNRPVNIYGRRAKLNQNGGWDTYDYFSAEGGQYGWFSSLQISSTLVVYLGRVSGEQQMGDGYDYDVTIVDAQTGQLLQQAYTGYHVVGYYPQYGRGPVYLDSAKLIGTDGNWYVSLQGSIPTWSPLQVEFKAPDSFALNIPLTPVSGVNVPALLREVDLNLGIGNPSATYVDVVLVVTSMRRHYTLPRAFVVTPASSGKGQ